MFSILKRSKCKANYLCGRNLSQRSLFAKFRLSDHRLNIERGRYSNTPRHERMCAFCPNHIENELHFLLHCSKYDKSRREFFNKLSQINSGFLALDDTNKMVFLLDPCARTIDLVYNFVDNATKIRETEQLQIVK